MICKIVCNDIMYTSYVFAIKEEMYNSKFLVLNYEKSALIWLDMYDKTDKVVYLIDGKNSFITKKIKIGKVLKKNIYISGYDWIIDHINDIVSDINDIKMVTEARKLDNDLIEYKWKFINVKEDIIEFLKVTDYFKDCYISKMFYSYDELAIEINGYWDATFYLVFKGDIKFKFENISEIYSANIFMEDGKIYWIDSNEVNNSKFIEDNMIYFVGNSLKWKMEIDLSY